MLKGKKGLVIGIANDASISDPPMLSFLPFPHGINLIMCVVF